MNAVGVHFTERHSVCDTFEQNQRQCVVRTHWHQVAHHISDCKGLHFNNIDLAVFDVLPVTFGFIEGIARGNQPDFDVRVVLGKREAFTDKDGWYLLDNLNPGAYELSIDEKSLPVGIQKPAPISIRFSEEPITIPDADILLIAPPLPPPPAPPAPEISSVSENSEKKDAENKLQS